MLENSIGHQAAQYSRNPGRDEAPRRGRAGGSRRASQTCRLLCTRAAVPLFQEVRRVHAIFSRPTPRAQLSSARKHQGGPWGGPP
jgi:hypothetical protein